jgi:hypothetical protein
MEIPFLKGKNVKLTFQLAQKDAVSKNFVVQATSFEIEPDVTEIADGILGQKRDTLDSETNFYNIMMEVQVKDAKLLKAFLEHQEQKDLKVAMAQSGIGLLVEPHDGSQEGFACVGFVLGKWKFGISGRTDRFKVPVPGRCTDVVALPALP